MGIDDEELSRSFHKSKPATVEGKTSASISNAKRQYYQNMQ